jgi:hypothetical protein
MDYLETPSKAICSSWLEAPNPLAQRVRNAARHDHALSKDLQALGSTEKPAASLQRHAGAHSLPKSPEAMRGACNSRNNDEHAIVLTLPLRTSAVSRALGRSLDSKEALGNR